MAMGAPPPLGMTVHHLDPELRAIVRPVALAYRRALRLAYTSNSQPPEAERMAINAAAEEYLRLRPAEADRRAAASAVPSIIAAAINANPQWFWSGPDA